MACGVLAAAALAGVYLRAPVPGVAKAIASAEPSFVGEAVCASCHPREAAAWKGSHHQLAMQPANASTVLGDFSATTEGHGHEVAYTFGVEPLQQYLVPYPKGRLQGLPMAWDSRPAPRGQRWFHLDTDFEGENWNAMCADCHSTGVRKGWDAASGSYATQFKEMSVSCEACHGPGSLHAASGGSGLLVALDERKGISWTRDPATGLPARSQPRTSAREIETCARCHSRRGLLHEDDVHGQPVSSDYRVALLDDDLYYPDGQIKGEVYEYGSFLQSRMYAEGVTCSDCHDPHSGGLRASGNDLCLTCHAAKYATPQHHFHAEASVGARCVSCHMPGRTYMEIDLRHDHSLRVPRPDQSVALGVPNACNGCHTGKSAAWAAHTVEKWYGHVPSGFQQFAQALAEGGQDLLPALINDSTQPAIARASALIRAELTPDTFEAIARSLGDRDALVRRAAVQALASVDPGVRDGLLAPLLGDPVRAVRIEAASAMAGLAVGPAYRASLDVATAEFVSAQVLNGDRPEAHLDLANLHARQGHFDRAEAELKQALSMDPGFVPAAVNLADLYRVTDRDGDGERVLRASLARLPENAMLLHALGLVLVRENRLVEATESLGAAARLAPDDPRHGYVYAIALHDAGRQKEAVRQLEAVLRRHPGDPDARAALAAFAPTGDR